ncbi:hypothetical protein D3C78_1570450 [compost metagenome]
MATAFCPSSGTIVGCRECLPWLMRNLSITSPSALRYRYSANLPRNSWYTGRPMEPSAWNTGALRTSVLMLKNGEVTNCLGVDQVSPISSECMALMALPAQPPTETET